MNLILLEADELKTTTDVTLTGARAAHLLQVLKVKTGQPVRVGLLNGPLGTATVTSLGDGTVTMTCELEKTCPERPRVDLLLALPRPKVMRRLWAQLSALGVGQIILTNAERVERNYFDTHVLTPEFYRPLLIEGLQQARDTRLPVVSIHRQLKVLVEDQLATLSDADTRIVAQPAVEMTVGDSVRGRAAGRVLLAVGPEGGWNAFELRLLETHGFQLVGMSPRTLRVDTACIALLTLVHSAMQGGS